MATATLTSNPTVRRLMKEAHELSAASPSPSPYFYAHPVSDSDIFDWHFTIVGPPAPSPYADGIYHGRIVLPRQYPLRPPSFRFLTPSGRFEVNREICLSISGHHEETWQPAWGIRTALLALRSLMEGDAKGQVGGVDAREEVRREWARRSRGWKCDACCDGKTNEEALNEWREMCREKGVSVDEEAGEGSRSQPTPLPTGLRFGYKDEDGKVGNMDKEENKDELPSASATPFDQQPQGPATHQQDTATATSSSQSPATSSPAPATLSSRNPLSQPSHTATTVSSSTQPTRTTSHSNAQHQAHVSRRASQDSTAWMDGAIPILAVALILMVLKKWFLPYLV